METDPATAPARPRLLILRQAGDDVMLEALRLEARRFDWLLEEEEVPPAELPPGGPVALVRYLGRGRGAQLLVRTGGAGAVVVEDAIEPVLPRSDDVLAIRIAEVIRAHLLLPRTTKTDPPPTAEPSPPRSVPAPRPPFSPASASTSRPSAPERNGNSLSGMLSLGGVAYGSPGGVPPLLGIQVGGQIAQGDWAMTVLGIVPLKPGVVQEPEGEAEVRPFGITTSVGRRLQLGTRLRSLLGAGVAIWATDIQGTARAPYVSRSTLVWTVGPLALAALEVHLSKHLLLGLGASGGVSIPPVSVQFADREGARFGEPFGLIAIYGAARF